MKKIMKIAFGFMLVCLLSLNYIKADCNDEELNEWATKVEVVFTENTLTSSNIAKYAYFLSITPYREDVKIIVIDEKGNKAEGEKFEEVDLYGVGAFTNLEEETYKVNVYGAKGSKCDGVLLKKLTYTVPRFNRRVKDARCENNSDLEICKTFTNSTKDMTDQEFSKEINKYVKDNDTGMNSLVTTILSYVLFIVVPVLIVGIFYFKKIKKVKKEERER